jgi:tRNA(fMet)-specific endonuclease VapC
MRYLVDTNIVVFMLLSMADELSDETNNIIDNFESQLFTSSICVMEIIQLYRIGKIKTKKYKSLTALCDAIESEFFIKILPFTKQHTQKLSELLVAPNHNDPFDHSIISQAITDKLIVVSSDGKFKEYILQKLSLAYNKR